MNLTPKGLSFILLLIFIHQMMYKNRKLGMGEIMEKQVYIKPYYGHILFRPAADIAPLRRRKESVNPRHVSPVQRRLPDGGISSPTPAATAVPSRPPGPAPHVVFPAPPVPLRVSSGRPYP